MIELGDATSGNRVAIIMCTPPDMIRHGALQPHDDSGCAHNDFVKAQSNSRVIFGSRRPRYASARAPALRPQ
jgi:hypothetical protein